MIDYFFLKKSLRISLKILIIFLLTILSIIISPNFVFSQEASPQVPAIAKIDGYPVELEGDILFKIQERIASYTARERVEAINDRLIAIAQNNDIDIQDLTLENEDNLTYLKIKDRVIITVTDADAKAAKATRQALAEEFAVKIKAAIAHYRLEREPRSRLFAIIYACISTISVFILIRIVNWVFPFIQRRIDAWRHSLIPSLRIQNFELLSAHRVAQLLSAFFKLLRIIVYLGIFYVYIPTILTFFPRTRKLGQNLFHYLLNALNLVWHGLVNYLPNIFIISLVIIITHYILRFVKLFFKAIEKGNVRFPGFYQDWAQPTSNICFFIIIALAAAVIFPYLPGFKSPAFQGISVFLGILFSLGSTSAIANTVGGIILIYTRSFQLGDRVQIGDVLGDVEEKSLLVTRIRTPKNVLVTLPNSNVLNSSVINFSASARDTGIPLILHTTITLGYDVPWRKVHDALIQAAKDCPLLVNEPAPFVLQTSLDDFYVSYQLNAYTNETTHIPQIYSLLHQNIQDRCNEVDIEIMSPHYSALRDGNHTTIPEHYLPKDYRSPRFGVQSGND